MLPAGGAARVRRTCALTDEGTRAATGLSAALEPVALQGLDGEARALLGAIARGEPKGEPAAKALRALVERGARHRRRGGVDARRARRDDLARRAAARRRRARGRVRARQEARRDLRSHRRRRHRSAVGAARRRTPRAGEHARALVEAGLVAAETRELANDPFADAATEHAVPPTLTGGAGGGARGHRAQAGGAQLCAVPAARRDRLGQDRDLPAGHRRGAGARTARARAGARDLADAAAGGALSRPLRRSRRGPAQRAVRRCARRRLAPHPARAGRHRARRALGGVRAAGGPRHRRRRRGARRSFKQEEGVRYHGRDVALRARARRRRGGAARLGDAVAGDLRRRARRAARPADAARSRDRAAAAAPSSVDRSQAAQGHPHRRAAQRRCSETLAAGEQAILFLNRRGFSTFSLCKACGEAVRCRHCSVAMTYHRGDASCSATTAASRRCRRRRASPAASRRSRSMGYGTEQLEQLLARVAARRAHRAARSRHRRRRRARAAARRVSRARRSTCSSARRWSPRGTTSPA